MSTRSYIGTANADVIDTYLWNPAFDASDSQYNGWKIESLGGDDLINYHSFQRSYFIDYITGGEGHDAVYFGESDNFNGSFWYGGGPGIDLFGIYRKSDGRGHSFNPSDGNPFKFIKSDNGSDYVLVSYENQSLKQLKIFADTEIIQLNVAEGDTGSTGSYYYLTEDIAKGIFRDVSLDELQFRTSGAYSDWYINSLVGNNLDSYAAWLEHINKTTSTSPDPIPNTTPVVDTTPTPDTTPTSAPEQAITADSNLIVGTNGKDKLKAKSSSISIDGKGGNDKIKGSNGDDTLIGGAGNDKLTGQGGKDLFICLEGKDVINDYDFDERDSIKVAGNFTMSKKKKHTLIRHEGGTVLVKKNIPKDIDIIDSNSSGGISTNSKASNSNYLELAKQSTLPRKKGEIKGTSGDDIIDIQRYYEDIWRLDHVRIGTGSDSLVFSKTPTYRVNGKGIEKLDSPTYALHEFDPLTGDKLLFDSAAFIKYDNILSVADSKDQIPDIAKTSTSFIYHDRSLYYNENGAEQGLGKKLSTWPECCHELVLFWLDDNNNLDHLSQAIEFI